EAHDQGHARRHEDDRRGVRLPDRQPREGHLIEQRVTNGGRQRDEAARQRLPARALRAKGERPLAPEERRRPFAEARKRASQAASASRKNSVIARQWNSSSDDWVTTASTISLSGLSRIQPVTLSPSCSRSRAIVALKVRTPLNDLTGLCAFRTTVLLDETIDVDFHFTIAPL